MYKVIIKNKEKVLAESVTLGNAFNVVDNYCKDNNLIYGLGNIYHEYDNQIGIDIYDKNDDVIKISILEC